MSRIVRSDDFSDEQLRSFLGGIERLDYFVPPGITKWVQEEAEAYSRPNPKPSIVELRQMIETSVQSSMGWDDPDQPEKMLHTALKSYYLIKWMEHLMRAAARRKSKLDPIVAAKVAFTPAFAVG